MHLAIYTLKGELFDGETVSFTCPTTAGAITILPKHRPLICPLGAGKVTVRTSATHSRAFLIRKGFLEVRSGTQARMIVED